jgi:hypothetical protein
MGSRQAAVVLTERERTRVREVVDELGLEGASRALGVSREPIARVMAGLDVRQGTLALLAAGLAILDGGAIHAGGEARGSPPDQAPHQAEAPTRARAETNSAGEVR